MSLTSLITAVAKVPTEEPAIPPWMVGVGSLGILLAMLLALMMFGKGREHS